MAYNKEELLQLPLEERKELASDLMDSILVEEAQPLPAWKETLLKERIALDDENPSGGIEWNVLRKKYFDNSPITKYR